MITQRVEHRWLRSRQYGRLGAVTLLLAVLTGGCADFHSAPAAGTIDIGSGKQLFIDDKFIERQENVSITMNSPVKKEMVLTATADEDKHEFMILSVLDVGGEYWMYYTTYRTDLPEEIKGYNRHVVRLAKSTNGLHWTRERVGLIDIGKGLDNNIVMTGSYGIFFIDPKETNGCRYWWIGNMSERPEWPETEGTFYRTGPRGDRESGLYACRSTDGKRWERIEKPILSYGCDTRNQGLYDPRIDKYVAYVRAWPTEYKGHRTVARMESDSPAGPWPDPDNPDRKKGKHGLYDALQGELPLVMIPADDDPPVTGIYTPNVHIYPWADNAYLAFPDIYRCRDGLDSVGRDQRGREGVVNEGPLDIGLSVSRDGVHWHRFRSPYVRLGMAGEVDSGTLYMGVGMIRQGNEIWQYASVSPLTHHGHGKRLPGTDGGIRRLVQRLDGFVSADVDHRGGEIVTPAMIFAGNRLELNVDCSALGEVWVEIQDAQGKSIRGYAMDDAVSVDMNGVAKEVWWKQGPDVGELAGRPVKLRFKMRSARLYAFQFVDSESVNR